MGALVEYLPPLARTLLKGALALHEKSLTFVPKWEGLLWSQARGRALGWLWRLGIGEGLEHVQKGSGRFISRTRRTQKLLLERQAAVFRGLVSNWLCAMLSCS